MDWDCDMLDVSDGVVVRPQDSRSTVIQNVTETIDIEPQHPPAFPAMRTPNANMVILVYTWRLIKQLLWTSGLTKLPKTARNLRPIPKRKFVVVHCACTLLGCLLWGFPAPEFMERVDSRGFAQDQGLCEVILQSGFNLHNPISWPSRIGFACVISKSLRQRLR